MPWVLYRGKERTLAGVALRPGRNFLQAEEVNRLNASAAGNRLFATGELSLVPVEEVRAKNPGKPAEKADRGKK